MSKVSAFEIYQKLQPFIIDLIANSTRTNVNASGALVAHDLYGDYHTGTLDRSQAPWVATDISSAITTHASDPDAHHLRLHSITSVSDHSVTGSALDIVGLSATNTLGILTPSSAPGATSKILKSDTSGFLTLPKLVATTKITTPLIDTASGALTILPAGAGVQINNASGTAGSIQLNSVGNYSPTNMRGSIIMSRNADLSFDGTDWTKTSASSDSVAIIERFPGQLAFYTIVSTTTFTDLSDTDFRSTYERITITETGNVGFGDITPSYRIDAVGDVRATVSVRADTSLITPLVTTATGDLTLAPADDIMLDPTSNLVKVTSGVSLQSDNYTSQLTGWRATYDGQGDFRYLFVDEMHAKSFIADLEQALAGGQIITKSVTMIYSTFTAPAAGGTTTLTVRDLPSATGMAVFVNGDYVRLRKFSRAGGGLDISDCWGTVVLDTSYGTSGFDSATKSQRYTFTRSASPNAGAMTSGTTVLEDAIVLDYGTSGNGYYEVNAIDGLYGANSPYAQIVTWETHPRNVTLRSRLGNLYGIWSVANEYGLYAGNGVTDDDSYLRISNNAVRLNNVPLQLYSSGTQKVNIDANGTNVWIGVDDTDKRLSWNGSTLAIEGDIVITGGSGIGSLSDAGALAVADDLDDVPNGSTYFRTTANQVTGAGRAYTAINSSNNLVTSVIPASAITPSGAGLYLGSNYMGYYDSSVWKTYIASNGDFKMAGSDGTNYLQWDASANKLQGVGGGVEQWYADATDGKLYAAAGSIGMDSTGLWLRMNSSSTWATANAITFRNATTWSTVDAVLSTRTVTSSRYLNLLLDPDTIPVGLEVIASPASQRVNITHDLTVEGDLELFAGDIVLATSATVDGVDVSAFKTAYDSHNHSGVYLPLSGGTLTNTLTTRDIAAHADSTDDIGTASVYFDNIYVRSIHTDTIVGTPSYAHSHDSTYVNVTGDTMSDQLTMSFDNFQMIVLDRTANANVDSTFYVGVSYITGVSDDFAFFGKSNGLQVYNDGTVKVDANTVWHAGNDGSGSGLDADTVDSIQGASIVQTSRTVTAGSGLTGGGALSSNITISHSDTSSQASVNNSGSTFIQDVTLDTYGHVTALVSADASTALSGVFVPVARTVTAGTGLTGGGALSANITISHDDTSSQASVNNSAYNFIQDVTLDGFGHVTALVSVDAATMLSGYVKTDGTTTGATSQKQVFTNGVDVATTYYVAATQAIYVPGGSFLGTYYFGDGGASLTYGSGNDGRYITAVGLGALKFNTTGNKNNAMGTNAMRNNTTGQINNAMGYNALTENTTGSYNNAFGSNAVDQNTTGSYNSGIGFQALHSLISGDYNTAIGYRAGWSTTGSSNIFIGANAGYSETGSNKLYIDNTNTASPLIYGDFSSDYITINGDLDVTDTFDVTGAATFGNNATITGVLSVAANTDSTHIIGRSRIDYAAAADSATFAHYDYSTSASAALAQFSSGATQLQAAASQYIDLAIDGSAIWTVNEERLNPQSSMVIDVGDYNRMVRTLFAAELYVQTLVAQEVISTIGGQILVAPTTKLMADVTGESGGYGTSALYTNLISYWPLDEASGSRADSVLANNLTDNNTVTSTTGKQSNAAVFTKANSEYLSTADNAALSAGDVDFYVSCWIYPTLNDGSVMTIVSKGSSTQKAWSVNISWADSKVYFDAYTPAGALTYIGTTGTVTTNTWYFVEAWHDATANTITIALNGTSASTAFPSGGVRDDNGLFMVGASESGAVTRYYQGRIDELGFWKNYIPNSTERTWLRNSTTGRTHDEVYDYEHVDGATTIDVEHNELASGDYVVLKTAPGGVAQFEVMKIDSSYTDLGIGNGYRYTVIRGVDGSFVNNWYTGDAVASLGGAVGEGYIDLAAVSTVHNHIGPTMAIYSRTATTSWDDMDPTVAVGNLRSFVDYASDKFGIALGNDLTLTPTSGFKGLTADATDGIRLFNVDLSAYNSTVQTASLSTTGNLKLGTNVSGIDTTTFEVNTGTGVVRLGPYASGKGHLRWDGTNLDFNIYNATFIRLASTGAATFEGVINLGDDGGIYQGSGTFASPTTGLKIWKDGGLGTGRIAAYNTGTVQWYAGSDGRLYAGAGAVKLDASGITVTATNDKFTVDTSGNIKAGTNVSSVTTTSLDFVASDGKLRIGPLVASKANLYFDGTDLNLQVNATKVAVLGSGGTMLIGREGTNLPNLYFDGSSLHLRKDTTNLITLDNSGNSYFAGVMTIGTSGEIRQGSGTIGSNFTGLRIWRDSSIGRIAGYNSGSASPQWYADTDGKLYAGGANVKLDSSGITLLADTTSTHGSQNDASAITFARSNGTLVGRLTSYYISAGTTYGIDMYARSPNQEISTASFGAEQTGTIYGGGAAGAPRVVASVTASGASSTLKLYANEGIYLYRSGDATADLAIAGSTMTVNVNVDVNGYDIYDVASLAIGTSSTSHLLEVAGSLGNVQVETQGAVLNFTRGGANYIKASSSSGTLSFITNALSNSVANASIYCDASQQVGIKGATPSYALDVNGSTHASSFPTSSDARFKENLRPITGTLDKFAALTAYNFTWTKNYSAYDQFCDKAGDPVRQLGFLAQDVAEQFPEVITRWQHNGRDGVVTKDAYSVDYARMVPLLAVAIGEVRMEARTETEVLRQRIVELESEVKMMKARLN